MVVLLRSAMGTGLSAAFAAGDDEHVSKFRSDEVLERNKLRKQAAIEPSGFAHRSSMRTAIHLHILIFCRSSAVADSSILRGRRPAWL